MTHDDVSHLERELGITVPADYRALVTNYPPELYQHAADFDLMDDVAGVTAINRELRSVGCWGITWPSHYFAIGEDGCGNYHCLDLMLSRSPVIFFDHETRSFIERAPSLQDWWPMVVRDYEES